MQLIEVAGVEVAYEVVGRGPVVLMTHGFGASSHMFAANARSLAEDHSVVSWDIRGHGQSGSPPDPDAYSPVLAVADMAAILDSVGADRAVVAGHSLGGFLSLAFTLAHPERVRGLILIDTGPGFRQADGRAGWNKLARRFAADFEAHGLAGHQGGAEFSPEVHRGGAAGLARAARGILTQHDSLVIDSLPTIAVPTLIIVGEDDAPFLAGSTYMAGKIPDATLVVIAGAGHAPNVTHPDDFDAAVRDFLDRIARDDDLRSTAESG